MTILMFVIASLSLIFQHNDRFSFKMPLYQIDWLSMLLMGTSAMSFNVFFTFMRQQGWFISPYITGSLILGIVFLILTIYRQKFIKRRMFKFELFYKMPNVGHSLILLIFLGIFLAGTSIYTQYTVGVLGYNNLINAKINLWMIPGVVIAGAYAFQSFKHKWKIKYYITSGFLGLFFHTLCLYLLIQPQMNIEYLEYSMILKGFGMGALFIGIWFYASLNLSMDDMFGTLSILLMFRSFIATAIGGSIIGWATYQGQWQSLSDISLYLDTNMIQNGMSIFRNINLNAVMASGKIVLGSLCWMIVPVLIFVLSHHYGQFNYRRVVILRKVIKGDSIKGYRFSR